MAVSGRAASNNMVCYQESSAALQEVATKSAEGNTKCNNILTNAQTQADNELEENRKTLDEESQDIQISLTSCDASTLPNAADALECYETQVIFKIASFHIIFNIFFILGTKECQPSQQSFFQVSFL